MAGSKPDQVFRGEKKLTALALLPGLDGTGSLFDAFTACLDREIETIVIAYPADTPLGYRELEARIRSRLPADRPFFLLAESFSGPLGIAIASDPPYGMCGLILSCTFARSPLWVPKKLRTLLPIVSERVPVWLLGHMLFGREASSAFNAVLAKTLDTLGAGVIAKRLLEVLSVDVSDRLAQIKIPILYLQAENDRVVSKRSLKWMLSVNPKIEIAKFEAPHMLLQVQPKPVSESVADFINKFAKT